MLRRAKALAQRRKIRNITWKRGSLERLPVRTAAFDLVLLSQALHHAEHPERTIAEAYRILRPGGRVLVLDLREHDQAWVRKRFGDRHLGFSSEQLDALLRGAGLREVKVNVGASKAGDPFAVLIASGTKA